MRNQRSHLHRQAQLTAWALLESSGAYTPSSTFVDLNRLAGYLGVDVQYRVDIGGAPGGLLLVGSGPEFEGEHLAVKVAEAGYRRRFTLAHELGHAAIRKSPAINLSSEEEEIFVDAFASQVLLPGPLLSQLIAGNDVLSINALDKLSRQAKVSLSALVSRISSANDLDWSPRNFVFVSTLGVSRRKRENLAPRILTISSPKGFYVPTNRRLRKYGLDYLEKVFDTVPLYLKNALESPMKAYSLVEKKTYTFTLLFDYVVFSTSDGSRLMLATSEPVDICR